MNDYLKKLYTRNIKLVQYYTFFQYFVFFFPIMQLFFQEKGITLYQIGIISAVSAITMLILEIPTGIVADKYGRKYALILGGISLLLAMITLIFGNTFIHFVIMSLFWGNTLAWISGSKSALLYESLLSVKREKEFKKTYGKIWLYASIGGAVSAGISSSLYSVDIRLPFILSMISGILMIVIATMFKETEHKQIHKPKILSEAFKTLKNSSDLKFILVYSVIIGFGFSFLFKYAQVYFDLIGVAIFLIGPIYGIRLLVEGFGGIIEEKFEKITSKKFVVLSVPLSIALISLMFGLTHWYLGVILFILVFLFFGIQRVIIEEYVNERIPSKTRATIKSMISAFIGISIMIFEPILGLIADINNIQLPFLIMGIATVLYSFIIIRNKRFS